jgi:hypothetical protein
MKHVKKKRYKNIFFYIKNIASNFAYLIKASAFLTLIHLPRAGSFSKAIQSIGIPKPTTIPQTQFFVPEPFFGLW